MITCVNLAAQFNVYKNPAFGEEGEYWPKRPAFIRCFPSIYTNYRSSKLQEWECRLPDAQFPLCSHTHPDPLTSPKALSLDERCVDRKLPSKARSFSLLPPFLPKRRVLNTLNWTAKFTNAYLYNLEVPKKGFPYTPFSKTYSSLKIFTLLILFSNVTYGLFECFCVGVFHPILVLTLPPLPR